MTTPNLPANHPRGPDRQGGLAHDAPRGHPGRLLGFIPQASVVVIGTGATRGRIRVTLRYDLPDPPGLGAAADLAAHAAAVIGSQRLDAAVAVGYSGGTLVTPVAEAPCGRRCRGAPGSRCRNS